jgi:hypothetical protein
MPDIRVFRDEEDPNFWRIEDYDDHGAYTLTLFGGKDAERRAREFAKFRITSGIAVIRSLKSEAPTRRGPTPSGAKHSSLSSHSRGKDGNVRNVSITAGGDECQF